MAHELKTVWLYNLPFTKYNINFINYNKKNKQVASAKLML